MDLERLVLPFRKINGRDVPVGCTAERLTTAMLAEADAEDGWTYTAGERIMTRIETRNVVLSADLADRIGLGKLQLFSDQDEYVQAVRTSVWSNFYYSVYRVRFDAGQVADDEPVAEGAVFQKGSVVRDADGFLYVLWPLPDRLDCCYVARARMDACILYDMSMNNVRACKQLSFVRVYTRDDYVLK